ncbi:MAG: hypothetical protein C4584_02655 [Armatimonadetes bacterium]|nr:MAG: hypothetical protein C4584_02655 [Armatimonadota bacterium]
MENNAQAPSQKPSPIPWIIISIFTFITGFLLAILYLQTNPTLLSSSNPTNTKQTNQKISEQKTEPNSIELKIPKSTKKGFPIIDNNTLNLYIYSFAQNKLLDTKTTVDHQGFSAGLGSSTSLQSPNLFYTAFIDKDKNLWIQSNETLEKTQITKNSLTYYISGWSPDSKKLVYWIASDKDIQSRKREGMGGPVWEGKEKFNKNHYPGGFYLLDIENRRTQNLYPLTDFETFIGNDKILVSGGDDRDRLIIFDYTTFEADYSIKDTFGFGANQFNISPDGTQWTYTLSRNPTEDANIIFAPFPDKEGTQIDSGRWADVQFPIFSPSAKKIAYIKREGYISSGHPREMTWVYDIASKTKSGHIQGEPTAWVDENTIVVRNNDHTSNITSYYLLDIASGQSNKIY